MKLALVNFVCLLLLVGSHAGSSLKQRIFGGQNADISDHPYQVSLRFLNKHFCGGAIIGKRHVLTAAHCIDDVLEDSLYVLITAQTGSTLLSGKGGKVYNVKNAVAHEDWSSAEADSYKNDIAILTLTKDIEFNDSTRAIGLPTEDVNFGDKAVITGWGAGKLPTTSNMKVLQKAQMNFVPKAECEADLAKFKAVELTPGQVCAYQQTGVGICSGDSGGPLAVGNVLAGVTSWGKPCGQGVPDVYTKVYYYRDWILKQMEN